MSRSDEELVTRLGTDPEAFEEFYRRHVRLVTSVAARRADRPEQVGDVVADVFLEVVGKAGRYDGARGSVVGWLIAITLTAVAGQRRSDAREQRARRRLSGQRLLDPDDHARLEAQIDAVRLAPALVSALDALPESERNLLELVSEEGLTTAHASRLLGIAPAAGRMRLARARRKVRAALRSAEHRVASDSPQAAPPSPPGPRLAPIRVDPPESRARSHDRPHEPVTPFPLSARRTS